MTTDPSASASLSSMLVCPKCGAGIPTDAVSDHDESAHCRACSRQWTFEQFADACRDRHADHAARQHPPRGCTTHELPSGVRITVTARSKLGLFFALGAPFVVTIVTGAALGGRPSNTFELLIYVPLVSAGAAVGLAFIVGAVLCTIGRVTVTLSGDHADVRTGVGPLAWRRSFQRSDVTAIELRAAPFQLNNLQGECCVRITRRNAPPLKFGSIVRADRQLWLAGTLRRLLQNRP